MVRSDLSEMYRDYIGCLNAQDWPNLGQFVHDDVSHNDQQIGLSGYRAMLENDFDAIPDLRFHIQLLIADRSCIASRLSFDCAPKGKFLGLPVKGKRVTFAENVFYEVQGGKIWRVWSLIDKAAIEAQLSRRRQSTPSAKAAADRLPSGRPPRRNQVTRPPVG